MIFNWFAPRTNTMGRKQSKKDLNDKARQRRENQRAAHKTGETNPDDSNQFILVAKKKKKEVLSYLHRAVQYGICRLLG